MDVEFLLDALARPSHSREAQALFSRAVSGGWIRDHHVSALHVCPASCRALSDAQAPRGALAFDINGKTAECYPACQEHNIGLPEEVCIFHLNS